MVPHHEAKHLEIDPRGLTAEEREFIESGQPLFEGSFHKQRTGLSRNFKGNSKQRFLRLFFDRLEYGKWDKKGIFVPRRGSPLSLNRSLSVTVEGETPRAITLRVRRGGADSGPWAVSVFLDDPQDKKNKWARFLAALKTLEWMHPALHQEQLRAIEELERATQDAQAGQVRPPDEAALSRGASSVASSFDGASWGRSEAGAEADESPGEGAGVVGGTGGGDASQGARFGRDAESKLLQRLASTSGLDVERELEVEKSQPLNKDVGRDLETRRPRPPPKAATGGYGPNRANRALSGKKVKPTSRQRQRGAASPNPPKPTSDYRNASDRHLRGGSQDGSAEGTRSAIADASPSDPSERGRANPAYLGESERVRSERARQEAEELSERLRCLLEGNS
mmetsp:Transcript_45533/g.102830  ORF Transcript_45533/g.102830 Transcript_45533/m.102830 type:complete len:395 (-) Transcript_45533:23-1207(-)|eukprot:CAMPEP_0172630806 /NCGR_PEP_ID=MMETSP1068-20121228/175604_1 /TAXON_ID=35684 /ORGANISM="Pseudopedinella elastica, Strain CCMP716" /LENGTH=394 /DNA_ID=CAMNT_0013441759 /DNA_START=197 /DNA_END=1381 /DNA_ORIENTATION=+